MLPRAATSATFAEMKVECFIRRADNSGVGWLSRDQRGLKDARFSRENAA